MLENRYNRGFITPVVLGIVTMLLVVTPLVAYYHNRTEKVEPLVTVGAAPRIFFSEQVGANPVNGYVLTTDGTNSTWQVASGTGSGTTTAGLGTTSPFTTGQLTFAANQSELQTVATGTLTTTATGTQLSATGALVGTAAIFSWLPGYDAVLAASSSNWNTFYNTPSTRITAGTNLSWSGNTLNSTAGSNWTVESGGLRTSTTTDYAKAAYFTATGTNNSSSFAGRIGIGTLTPTVALQIASDTPPSIRLRNTTSLTTSVGSSTLGMIEFEGNRGGLYRQSAYILARQAGTWSAVTTTTAPTAIEFYTLDNSSGTGTTSPRLTIAGNGMVGVATSSPTSILHSVTTDSTSPFTAERTGANSTRFQVTVGGNGLGLIQNGNAAADNWISGANPTVGYSISNSNAFGTSDRLTITRTTGNVGIGTTTPNAALAVVGNLRVTGAIGDSASSTGASGTVLMSTAVGTQWTATSSLGITSGGGSGDMILASTQTNSGLKTFLDTTFGLRNVANTFTGLFTNAITAARTWALPDKSGTVALTTDVPTYNSSSTIPRGGWTSDLQIYSLAASLGFNYSSELSSTTAITDSVKPLWLGISSSGGYEFYTASSSNPYGYSTANQKLFEERAGQRVMPFVSDTYSGAGGPKTMIGATTTRTTWITSAVSDAVTYNWRGIAFDIEGFGSWSAASNTAYKVFVTAACTALHNVGKICQIYLPPMWNSTTTPSESGTGDEWDTRNSDGYYPLTYQEYDALGVDFIEIPLYDYEFDLGSEAPEAPLRWITDVANYARSTIDRDNKIVIGISAQSHWGASGYGDFHSWTYASSAATSTFANRTRDTASGELFWLCVPAVNCWAADNTTMDLRRSVIEAAGIQHVSIWYLGGGQYGGTPDTVLETKRIAIGTTTSSSILFDIWNDFGRKLVQVANDGILSVFGTTTMATTTISTLFVTDKVGIGTTTPTVGLDLYRNQLAVTSNGASSSPIIFRNSLGGDRMSFQYDNVNIGLSIADRNNVPVLYVAETSSRVGIGTTSPIARLSVTGASSGIVAAFVSNAGTKFMEMLNTGVTTLLGTWDFTAAVLRLPYSAAPTISTNGDTGIDSTSNQFKYQSGGATKVLGNGSLYPSFTINATGTAFIGTTTYAIGTAFIGETWNSIQCFTDVGTVNVQLSDGTNSMNLLVGASTTVSTFTLSTNNTFTALEKRYVTIGTPASSPTTLSCTINKSITAD